MPAIAARRVVSAVFFMCGTFIGLWASRIPDIKTATGLSEGGFGILLLVMAVGALLAFPLAGALMDRKGSASVTKMTAIATVVAFALIGLAPSTPILTVTLFMGGFAFGALDVSMNGWGAEVEKRLERPIMSSFHGLFSLGAGVAAAAGGVAIKLGLSVTQHFCLWSALAIPILVWTLRQPWSHTGTGVRNEGKSPLFAIPKGALFLAGLIALVAALGEGAMTDWAALYQIYDLGYSEAIAPTAFTVFSVAMVIMRLAGDRVIALYGPVAVARASGLVASLGCLLLVSGLNIWTVWAGSFVMGLGYAVLFPLAMSRAASDPHMSTGQALAAVATLGYGAFLFGPPLLGFIGDLFSLRMSFGTVAFLTLAIPLLAGSLKVKS
ncbi:MFS transporter [Roseibium album]|uniref:Inner membrane protein YbjJ n=1 Tax=Roseibium album TaxID=311410 RepID=A0A0M7A652_9HYPH|nr:MFS transporter [Roseibium album]CTQ57283.1 Inner membrane protein YbjJ [Roseibium album]CTQ69942.1 Inner membrane protein YbjJ [Roseibium album]CTQ71930.1 Inner membrane protein YbjJ [Roseibium album]